MSNEQTPDEGETTVPAITGEVVTIEVQKSDLSGLLASTSDVGIDGEYLWPISVHSLSTLYRASPEHSRAIHVKAEGAFGGGLIGDEADVEKLEALCETGAAELFMLLDLDIGTFGNAFLQVIRSRDGERIVGLRRLPAITMSRFRDGFLQRVSKPGGETKKFTFTAREIVHLRAPCPMGRRYAYPEWISAEGMLELAHAATRYNASFFKNNAIPEYAIIFKGATPSADQKRGIAEFFRNEHQGVDNAHRTLVMSTSEEGAIEVKRLTAEVKDGDFLKLIDAARDRIPVAHGTPPRVLGIMTAGQLGGGGEVTGQLFTFEHLTLKPKRRRMLDQIRPLLAELGLKPGRADTTLAKGELAFRPLDLTPPKDDAEDLPGLVGSGILDVDEARALIPAIANASQGGSAGSGRPVERAAPTSRMDALVAILARS